MPHVNRLEEVDGRLRMVGFNGVPVVDGVSAQERNGSVLAASIQIEEFMVSSPAESMAVLNSPQGWSGFADESGKMIEFQNSQVMVFWKDRENQLNGLTLVTDLKLEQSRELSLSLGVDAASLEADSEKEQIASIVGSPAKLAFPSSEISPAEYVLDKIASLRGRDRMVFGLTDGTTENRLFSELENELSRFRDLLKYDARTESYISQLKHMLTSDLGYIQNLQKQKEMIRLIENTVTVITNDELDKKSKTQNLSYRPSNIVQPLRDIREVSEEDLLRSVNYLQRRPGCQTGGVSMTSGISILGGYSIGSIELSGAGSDKYGSLEFECPHCKRKIRRPENTLIPNCTYSDCGKSVRC